MQCQFLLGVLPSLQQHFSVGLKFTACDSEFDPRFVAREQLLAQLFFQRSDAHRYRGLRNAKPVRSLVEASSLNQLKKGTRQYDVQGNSPPRTSAPPHQIALRSDGARHAIHYDILCSGGVKEPQYRAT